MENPLMTRPPQIQANTDDEDIRQAIAQRHNQVFRERFPQSIEHHMRLVSERLGVALRDKTAPNNGDVYHLCSSLDILYRIWQDLDRA